MSWDGFMHAPNLAPITNNMIPCTSLWNCHSSLCCIIWSSSVMFFFYSRDYTWPSITGSVENLCLKPSDEYTFQYFIASVKKNSSLKFVECFPVAFILFYQTCFIHNAFWSVESVFMHTRDSMTTTNMCKVVVKSAHTYVNS